MGEEVVVMVMGEVWVGSWGLRKINSRLKNLPGPSKCHVADQEGWRFHQKYKTWLIEALMLAFIKSEEAIERDLSLMSMPRRFMGKRKEGE